MKKIVTVCLLLALLLGLAACGKSPEEKWQEQYELGMKYVSEGNYEEAVLAFTAAIEIDPKNVDAYMGLADIYENRQDYGSLRAILQQGVEATDDAGLRERMEMLPPELPEAYVENVWEGDYGRLALHYEPMTPELEEALSSALDMGINCGETPSQPEYLMSEEFAGSFTDYAMYEGGNANFWTMTGDGAVVRVSCQENNDYYTLEYRLRDGQGFYWSYQEADSGESGNWRYVRGEMKDYLFHGAFVNYSEHWQLWSWFDNLLQTNVENSPLREREIFTGTADGEWLEGEVEQEYTRLEGPSSFLSHRFNYRTYKDGICQAVYTNGAGEAVKEKTVLDDGRIVYEGDTIEVDVTDQSYEAGDHVGFGGNVYDDSYRLSPVNGF